MDTLCTETTNYRTRQGYGRSKAKRFGHKINYAHILAWIDHYGTLPPPETPWILHRCDNPPCVRIDHLYAGTVQDNVRDMMERGRHENMNKTHCPRGHGFTPENTYVSRGRRNCRACERARRSTDEYREAQRAYQRAHRAWKRDAQPEMT